jgi:ElaB/YqjD/DUF883 family membrane-anchored ribosome-binding protein
MKGSSMEALKQFFYATEGNLDEWVEASQEAWESIEDRAEQQLETAHAAMKTAQDHKKFIANWR